MDQFTIFETDHWIVSHRRDARYPGYLIDSSCEQVGELSELTSASLASLGNVLSKAEKLLTFVYTPHKIIMAKLGFLKGFNCHFHVIPISSALLQEIVKRPNYILSRNLMVMM